jgi:anthranilate phosphoribosyltransferase
MTREEANRIADAILESESAERERCARIADLWVKEAESAERERCARMLDQRASELEIEFPNGGAVARIHELVEQAKRIREGGHA